MAADTHPLERFGLAAVVLAATVVAASHQAFAQAGCASEDFTAWAVNRGPSAFFLTTIVDIHVARWSTEREKDRFVRALLDEGPAALQRTFRQSSPVGAIRSPVTFPDDIVFAWQEPSLDGGRRIVLITDRPMALWTEAMRVSEDTFTVLELRIGANGDGEGKAEIGSNVTVDRNLDLIELKDYAASPVRLIEVRSRVVTSEVGEGHDGR